MQLLKDDTVNNTEITPVVLGEMLNNNKVELTENNWFYCFMNF